jgi:type I restriction enzyme R subunit
MPITPEDRSREQIDTKLSEAGWIVQDMQSLNLGAGPGIAVREMPLRKGHGTADYLLYADRKALGVIEAKKEGDTLSGVEVQTEKYGAGLPSGLPAWRTPLPFLYQSTGIDTHFTNTLDPDPRSREIFSFHRPATLTAWAQGLNLAGLAASLATAVGAGKPLYGSPSTLLSRLKQMPPLDQTGMRDAQVEAITNLETSLADNRPRALVQMATGSGKTYMAVAEIYRLIKYAGASRVLFLVDRGNLGAQAFHEFKHYTTPDDGRKFTELYNVQHLRSNTIDKTSRVCISTIQRLFSILKGEPEMPEELDERSAVDALPTLSKQPVSVAYNPAVPIETFDLFFIDECHRSIYNLWRQVLEYFDAYLIGLTATPSAQTFGYFKQNLVMEYSHERAVADSVNVDFNVYEINTKVTQEGGGVRAGYYVDRRDRRSRKVRWEQLESDLDYRPNDLDNAVVAVDQIRTIIQTFRDRLFIDLFPGRTVVPKTLIFAKSDSHADDIVRIVREEFGKGNQFCEKITYRTSTARIVDPVTGKFSYKSTGITPEDLLSSFRNSYNPRIAVTVDMIATGTDVKPLEIVFFMRDVKSANYFEQMKGRGSRVISEDEFRTATPEGVKTRFVIVDAVGACRRERTDSPSLDRQPTVPLKRVLQLVGQGSTEEDVVSTLASRLARLDRRLTPAQRAALSEEAGVAFKTLIRDLVAAVDAEALEARARVEFTTDEPTEDQIEQVATTARQEVVKPLLNNKLRDLLLDTSQETEQTIDWTTKDTLLSAGHSEEAKHKAKALASSFADYLKEHRDEITAIEILYSRPFGKAPSLKQLKALAADLAKPPRQWTPDALWRAYETLEKSKVRGGPKQVSDLVSLIRFALEQETILAPFAETVNDRFEHWITAQAQAGRTFTPEQRRWLEMIRDHIAGSLTVEPTDFEYVPFSEHGGLGRAHAVFGDQLKPLLEELNEVLAA